ncbi:MAG TPA: PqqD family protein [Vicinamibacterales bacterium]|nr:PqqD family protein [Vicinamibacterales bacterium]
MRPSPDVVWRDLDGEAVLLDLSSGAYFGLNQVGTRIWQLLEAGRLPDQIARTIVEEYDVDRPTAERDVAALVDALVDRRLIRRDSPP